MNGARWPVNGRRRRAARAIFVCCVTVLVVAAAFSGVSVGDEHGDIAVEQDGTCRVVNPVSTDESAEEFYQYRSPDDPGTDTYSSHGTVDYQRDDTSILLFHEGPDGTSLVIVHDRLAPAGVNGTDGGTASFEVSGLPTEGEWTVEDDDYPNQTDEFVHEGTESELHWVWVDNRTDGAAFTGVESASAIRINPRFNEDAEIQPRGPREDGVISAWQAIDATDGGFDRVSLNLSEPLRIWPGGCQDGPAPAASLSANATNASAGETVRFDASGTTSLRPIAEYRWDLTGDGETDTVTAEPTLDHAFQSAGTYDVTVTAVDDANATGTANRTVTVGEGDAPAAVLNGTDGALVNETVQFDAGGSTTDDPPATYEWRVDGETVATTNESSYERAFESPGEYTLTVVVTDAVGRTDEASETVTVDAPLSAAIDPPSTPIAVNESVTFDGGGSTGNITSYEWTFGDEAVDGNETDGNASDGNETTANATDSGETVTHSYESGGEYTVTLTVVAADGDTAQATETVTVETPAPTASIDAPETAGINESVTVDANASVAASGDRRFEWRIDGEVVEDANESTLNTEFDQAGEYTVSVTVTDDTGESDTDEVVVTVTQSLAAAIDANPDSPAVGEQVTFDGGGSTGNITSYEWTFGDENASDGDETTGENETDGNATDGNETDGNATDGNVTDGNATDGNATASGEAVTHTYESVGDYTVTLTVVAADGETATATAEIHVQADESDSGDGNDDSGNSGGSDGNSGGQSGGSPGGGSSGGSTGSGNSAGGSSGGGSSGSGSTNESDTADVDPETANLSVVDLTASEGVVDRPFDVTVSVRNSGTLLGTDEIPVTVDGEERATLSVTVPPNETVTENVSVTVAEAGTVRVAAGNASVLTAVRPARANLSVSALELENGPISAGDEAVLVATVRNDGTIPAEYRVELAVAGSVSRVETVRVPPAETARIRLRQQFEAPGTYTLSVGNRSAQITVDGDDAGAADAATTTAETTQSTDGFGILPALLAVVALALLGRFRNPG